MSHVQKSARFPRIMPTFQVIFSCQNFFHFPQLLALIDNEKIQIVKIPIFFSSAFDGVLQEFADHFQDFEISEATRHVGFPHQAESKNTPLNLQMEVVELKNNKQLVNKFKDQENLLDTWKDVVEYPKLQELTRKLSFYLEALTCAKLRFQT